MEEAPVYGTVAESADGAGVGIRQDGLRSVLIADFPEAHGDGVQRLIPSDALEGFQFAALYERAFGYACAPAHGIEQTIGRIDPIKILRHLAAEESARHRVIRISLHARCATRPVDGNQHAAGIGAIVRADGVDGLRRSLGSHTFDCSPARWR